jgi:hypothetical protein
MRLIRISDMKLVEFPYDPPPYGILSHTWGQPDDEVLFHDMESGPDLAKGKPAFPKVQHTCKLSEKEGLEYCWIDTCCIDKRSSAELQEAINSMYKWYEESKCCFVYLADVQISNSLDKVFEAEFRQARWFTRGWTLQELIAPAKVEFYNRDWKRIGSKISRLLELLHVITGIPKGVLSNIRNLLDLSVAERMSWASTRQTSRTEDTAYCLLGLFRINMPMLYGEGENAFIRLQQEILSKYEDESIFAWVNVNPHIEEDAGLLATHPSLFFRSAGIISNQTRNLGAPASMTGRGLHLSRNLLTIDHLLYILPLQCHFDGSAPTEEGLSTPSRHDIWNARLGLLVQQTWQGLWRRVGLGILAAIGHTYFRGSQSLYFPQETPPQPRIRAAYSELYDENFSSKPSELELITQVTQDVARSRPIGVESVYLFNVQFKVWMRIGWILMPRSTSAQTVFFIKGDEREEPTIRLVLSFYSSLTGQRIRAEAAYDDQSPEDVKKSSVYLTSNIVELGRARVGRIFFGDPASGLDTCSFLQVWDKKRPVPFRLG